MLRLSHLVRRNSARTGLPPGTLTRVPAEGEEAIETKIVQTVYDREHYEQETIYAVETCFPFTNQGKVTWISVQGLQQIEVLEHLGECLGIHPLVLEDILNTNQRPKIDDLDGYVFIVLKIFSYDRPSDEVRAEQISLILGPDYVVSFQETLADVFAPIRLRIDKGKGQIRSMGADYLAYALIDILVDHYFVVLRQVGEQLDDLEEELVSVPTPETLQKIHDLKRDMIFLRRSAWPLREIVSALQRVDSPLMGDPTVTYLRDAYDHTIQIAETVEAFRDVLGGMLDMYLSSVSNRMNEVMKILTVIATIFIPLTLIAGIYGMNFRYMPELEWRWGYPMVWLVMIAVVVVMVIYFRRKKWL